MPGKVLGKHGTRWQRQHPQYCRRLPSTLIASSHSRTSSSRSFEDSDDGSMVRRYSSPTRCTMIPRRVWRVSSATTKASFTIPASDGRTSLLDTLPISVKGCCGDQPRPLVARAHRACAPCRQPTRRMRSSSRSVLLFRQGLAEKGNNLIHRASCGFARRIYQVAGKDGMRRLSPRLHARGVSGAGRAVPYQRMRRQKLCAGSGNAMPGR